MNIRNIKKLLVTYFIEHGRRDLIQNGLLIFLVTLVLVLLSPRDVASVPELVVAVILIFFYASRMFQLMSNSSKRIHYLMIPANPIEKIVTGMLLVNVYFVLLAAFSVWLGYSVVYIFERFGLHTDMMGAYMSRYAFRNAGINFLWFYALLAIFFFGSVYFRKKTFIMTLLWALLVSIVSSGVLTGVMFLNLKSINPSGPYSINGPVFTTNKIVSDIIGGAATIIYFYVLSFLRLRETEV